MGKRPVKRRNRTRKYRGKGGGQETHTAVIIEPRKLKVIRAVLLNFLQNLDPNWNILFFHGNKNKEYVERIIATHLANYKDRIMLKSLNRDNLNNDIYNTLMMSDEILNQIPTEMFLVFQTDSLICEGDKHRINDFLKYDYVGSPWNWMPGGNGGLSLRRKSKMLEMVKKCRPHTNEDIYFSTGCPGVSVKIPSKEEAKQFGIETMYNQNSFGLHKSWAHLPQHDGDFEKRCKDYKQIKSEQGVLED
jgi:hypothetical protein